MMSVEKTVAINTLVQGFSKFVSILCSILLTILLTRLLGKDGFGVYTFITAFILLFGTISDWGTSITTVREASKDPEKSKQIFVNAAVGRFILSVLVFLIINLLIRIKSEWSSLVDSATIASFVILALSIKSSAGMVFHSFQRLELSSLMEIVSSVLFLIFVFLLLGRNASVDGVMVAWVMSTLLSAVLGILILQKYFNSILSTCIGLVNQKSLSNFFKNKFFKEALPAGFLFVLSTVYNRIDILILQFIKGSEAVASYGLSYRVYDQVILVAAFLMTSLFPVFAKSFADKNDNNLRVYYQRAFDVLVFVGIVLMALLFIGSPVVIGVLGGGVFSESIGVLKILSFAILPAFVNHLTGYSLLAFGKQKLSLFVALFALTVNIALNLLFIPLYSYVASAYITVVTETIVLIISFITVSKILKFTPNFLSFPSTLLMINRLYSFKNK